MSNELYHYGVPGMKWGVRRYQNDDGTLTDAGRRRYSSEDGPSRRGTRKADKAASVARAKGGTNKLITAKNAKKKH